MPGFIIQRLMHAAVVMLVISALVFVGVYAVGNPIDVLISPDATQQIREAAIRAYGLDQPLWKQYLDFLRRLAVGDFGRSFIYNMPVLELIASRIPATLELTLAALFGATLLGVPLGMYAGYRPDSLVAKTIMAVSILGFSVPTFWIGLVLIFTFAVQLGWLPAGGRGETASLFGIEWSFLTANGWKHEVVFVHRASRTLIATDLAFNVRGPKPFLTRTVMKLNDGWERFGPTRLFATTVKDPAALKASVCELLEHPFDRRRGSRRRARAGRPRGAARGGRAQVRVARQPRRLIRERAQATATCASLAQPRPRAGSDAAQYGVPPQAGFLHHPPPDGRVHLHWEADRGEPRDDESLLETLRTRLGLTSLKDGCHPQGQCGACLVIVDGHARFTCTLPTAMIDGHTCAYGSGGGGGGDRGASPASSLRPAAVPSVAPNVRPGTGMFRV